MILTPLFLFYLIPLIVSTISLSSISSSSSLSMSPLKLFLQRSRAVATTLTNASSQRIAVVIGNEAADADSIVSALTYAYLKQQQKDQRQTSTSPSTVIPLCSV